MPGQFTFDDFHRVIQAAFDWFDEHLYMFGYTPYDMDLCISVPQESHDEWDRPTYDSGKLTLEEFFATYAIKNKLCYVYDFGADWIHDITLEKKLDGDSERATCIAGKSRWSEGDTLDDDEDDYDYDPDEEQSWRTSAEGFYLDDVNASVEAVKPIIPKKAAKRNRQRKVKKPTMKHRVYPDRWMKRQPYSKMNETDAYYVDIANRVLEILDNDAEEFDHNGIDKECREEMAMALARWFEDVVAEGGIWKTFIHECKRRYGSYLPFYHIDEEDYYDDEVNLVDVKFLVWHYMQYMHDEDSVINPENIFVEMIADSIYEIFDTEFENAPINDDWHDALHPKTLAEPLLFSYREYLYKLINCNYLYLELFDSIQDYIEERTSDLDYIDQAQDLIHDYVTESIFDTDTNFLGMTLSQWGTEIIRLENAPLAERLDTIKTVSTRLYSLVKEDREYFHFVDYGDRNDKGGDTVYKVLKSTFGLYPSYAYKAGETFVLCRLTFCEGEWNLNGASFTFSQKDVDKEIIPSQFTCRRSEGKEIYELTTQKNGGKIFVFPNSSKEAVAQYRTLFGENFDVKNIKNYGDDIVIFASPTYGIGLAGGIRKCLKSEDNTRYDKETAKKEAFSIICRPDAVPYEVVCKMLDMGMLDDAALKSTKGYEYGRQFMHDNAQFFIDYFQHGRRDDLL